MAIVNEDFKRCKCGHAYFEERKVVSIHSLARLREDKSKPLESTQTEEITILYYCTACNKPYPI